MIDYIMALIYFHRVLNDGNNRFKFIIPNRDNLNIYCENLNSDHDGFPDQYVVPWSQVYKGVFCGRKAKTS